MPPKRKKAPMGKPQHIKQTIARIFSYMKEFRFHLALAVLCVMVSAAASIAGTYFLKPLINNFILPFIGQQNPDLSEFIFMLLLMALIYLFGTAATFISARIMLVISTSTLYQIRTDLFNKMQALPIGFFDSHTHGELMSRFTSDTVHHRCWRFCHDDCSQPTVNPAGAVDGSRDDFCRAHHRRQKRYVFPQAAASHRRYERLH